MSKLPHAVALVLDLSVGAVVVLHGHLGRVPLLNGEQHVDEVVLVRLETSQKPAELHVKGLNDVGNRVGTATRSQSAAKPADNAIVIAEDQALAPLVYQAPATQANVPSHGTARLPKGGHLRL